MRSSIPCLFLSLVLLIHVCLAQDGRDQVSRSCSGSNYTSNGSYQTNLQNLLYSLPLKNDIDYGFYNFTQGQGADKVYAIGLCRGDLQMSTCQKCLNTSANDLFQTCQLKKGIFWSGECMLRYSDRSIFGLVEIAPIEHNMNWQNISGVNDFVAPLLERLRDQAVLGDSKYKIASGNFTSSSFLISIFTYLQCTPDLNSSACGICLDSLIKFFKEASISSYGATISCPSCQVRYENYPFYRSTVEQLPPSSSPSPMPKGNNKTRRILIIAIVSTVGLVVIIACIYIFLQRRFPKRRHGTEDIENVECLEFDFETLRIATGNFSNDNKVGQGGFGTVYKGRLANGQEVAVKRLEATSGQGDLEFKNEVMLAAELQHRNLVKLLGFCLEGPERLLVYELLNASLDQFIFDPEKCNHLDWERRCKIIGGVAKGLLYLHEDSRLSIVHRDLKASNILLDEGMNPKIADFGMARLFLVNQTRGITSTIMGTYGYMAPEYALHGQFSVKSDVYSFGVLMLELISGQKNSNFRIGGVLEDLVGFAWKSWKAGAAMDIIDSALRTAPKNEITRCIHIGLLCVQDNETKRPTMSSVILMLTSISHSIPLPSEPAYFIHRSEASETPISENQISATDLYPR
ncbi:unnamed protein product [Rhodiola kirilowii]